MEAGSEVAKATRDQSRALAGMFGRAFVDEPMMRWPMGGPDDQAVDRFSRCFGHFLTLALELEIVWALPAASGAAVWIPPGAQASWQMHPWDQPEIKALTDDGGARYDQFWNWVATLEPTEPMWQLDSIAVEPASQGHGIGAALIEAGLARAKADNVGAFLSTGTKRNVAIYGRSGFHVVEEADAPGGGPHVWFMRWDP